MEMRCGSQVGTLAEAGTLTCFVEMYAQPLDASKVMTFRAGVAPSDKLFIMSYHVIQQQIHEASSYNTPLMVLQPPPWPTNYAGLYRIHAFPGKADAAVVWMNPEPVNWAGGVWPGPRGGTVPAYTGPWNNNVLYWNSAVTRTADKTTLVNGNKVKMAGMTSGGVTGTINGAGYYGIAWKEPLWQSDMQGFGVLADSDLHHGDSGGPVLNDNGDLIGMIVAIASEGNPRNVRCSYIGDVFDYLADNLNWWYNQTHPDNPSSVAYNWKIGLRLL
jgi:hypothetical protein